MRRLTIAPILFAAALALYGAPARAQQSFYVFFSTLSAEIDPAGRDVVAAAVAYANKNAAMRVDIIGFANTNGSRKANLYLSLLRAQLVYDLLAERGIADARMNRVGEGEGPTIGGDVESRLVEITVRPR